MRAFLSNIKGNILKKKTTSYEGIILLQNRTINPPTFTCSKLTMETLEQGVKCVQSSGVFTANFEHILHLVLVFLLLTLNK